MRKMGGLLVLGLLAGGCGVAEYEAALEKTQQRLAYLDREREVLAGPVELPDDVPRIHLRPPAGFATKPDRIEEFEGGRWLHFAWQAGPDMGAFHLYLGFPPRAAAKKTEDWIRGYLEAQGAEALGPRAAPRVEQPVRASEPPERRRAFEVRRLALRSEERPKLATGLAPEVVFALYDAYLYPAEGTRAVIVFKQFDRQATQERWQGKDTKVLNGLLPGDAQEKLFAEARSFSIATLRSEP